MLKQWYLITYVYQHSSDADGKVSFHYDVTDDIVAWVDRMNSLSNGPYVVNQLAIDEHTARRWDGFLRSM
jgi:hypothetical protein